MSLEDDLKAQLTDAMRAKDQKTLDVIRMIRTKIMERKTAPGFNAGGGVVDDALVLDVIGAYRKQLAKARDEFIAAGDKGKDQAAELEWEMSFCDRFLPKKLGGDELVAIVKAAIASTGATDVKQAGKVVGEIMKTNKGKVDAGEVKKLVEQQLSAGK
jgi:uncharacterized protein YqeY